MPKLRLPKSSFTGKQAEAPNVADFAGMGEVTLLSKAKALENLLNHVEDLKGTPWEEEIAWLAEKAPWVMGHVGQITTGLKKGLGRFFPGTPHAPFGNLKGLPIGRIELNEEMAGKAFQSDPMDTLAHEGAHAAQSLATGVDKFSESYNAAMSRKVLPYLRNEWEIGARKAGRTKNKQFKMRTPKSGR